MQSNLALISPGVLGTGVPAAMAPLLRERAPTEVREAIDAMLEPRLLG